MAAGSHDKPVIPPQPCEVHKFLVERVERMEDEKKVDHKELWERIEQVAQLQAETAKILQEMKSGMDTHIFGHKLTEQYTREANLAAEKNHEARLKADAEMVASIVTAAVRNAMTKPPLWEELLRFAAKMGVGLIFAVFLKLVFLHGLDLSALLKGGG